MDGPTKEFLSFSENLKTFVENIFFVIRSHIFMYYYSNDSRDTKNLYLENCFRTYDQIKIKINSGSKLQRNSSCDQMSLLENRN